MQDNDKDDDAVPSETFFSTEEQESESNTGEHNVPLMINGQYIKDLSFEAPNAPEIFNLIQNEVPNIEVNIDVEASPKAENIFEVELKVRADAKIKEQLVYLCEVVYAGLFTVNVSQEHVGPVLLLSLIHI